MGTRITLRATRGDVLIKQTIHLPFKYEPSAKELKEITVIAGEFKTDTLEITLEHNKVL